jgi:hypothetical protein
MNHSDAIGQQIEKESAAEVSDSIGVRFVIGMAILSSGYLTAFVGTVAFFKIPLVWTVLMMFCGLLVGTVVPKWFDQRLAFPSSSRTLHTVNFIGVVLIGATMVCFANSNWKTWSVHPAGFHSIWFTLVCIGCHLHSVHRNFALNKLAPECHVSDYEEAQASNPYAPPMHPENRVRSQ